MRAELSFGNRAFVVVFLLGLAGIIALLGVTRWGIGLDWDSVAYIAGARDILDGRGYSNPHWPPLLSIVLAALGVAGIDPLNGARWLNIALFGANIALVSALVLRYGGGHLWAGIFAGVLMLASEDMLVIHSMAWSEPLFIFLAILGMALLAEYLDHERTMILIASSATVACAFLTRYVGATLVVAGAAGLLILSRRPGTRRLADAATFVAVASLPTLLWMLRNIRMVGSATDRVFAAHPIGVENLTVGLLTVSAWVIPKTVPDVGLLSAVLGCGLAIGGATWWIRSNRRRHDGCRPPQSALPLLLGVFIVSYLLLLIVAISFLDLAVLDKRTLSPVFVAGLVLILCAAGTSWRPGPIPRTIRVCAVLLAVYLAGLHGLRGAHYAAFGYHEGLGYSGQRWRESPTIRGLAGLPKRFYVYSNYPDAIYILTGRTALLFPEQVDNVSGLRNRAYARELAEVKDRLGQGKAVVAMFTSVYHDSFEAGLERELPIVLAKKTNDGEIYRFKGVQVPGL